MKTKRLAQEIVDQGLDYALENESDVKKRIKAYRLAAQDLIELAAQMEYEFANGL